MPKTDKELTAEITIAYITGRLQHTQVTSIPKSDICSLIKDIYKTIHSLEEESK